jgi:uncharacterized peroxidase-related enzyme
MSGERASGPDWTVVDEGWGRKAVDFATLSEPGNCREYVALHHMLGVDNGDRLLDVACGAGLAIELASVRGADCAGIDASPRLVAVARDRSPRADIRVGDMHALPWDDGGFTVVTSFRGIWGTTPAALEEVWRVLRPGGRIGLTVWGHLKVSPGVWALTPFQLAAEPKVAHQAAMVALGRPGRGEELLARCGFVDVHRRTIPFAWEFADPESFARALASTGPAYEAIQHIGEPAFTETALQAATAQVRNGLPSRKLTWSDTSAASRNRIGLARDQRHSIQREMTMTRRHTAPREIKMASVSDMAGATQFLDRADVTEKVQALFDEDLAELGFVMNASRLWAYQPEALAMLFSLMSQIASARPLRFRERGILVAACASALGDSYCSLAWGTKLAARADAQLAAGVLRGDDSTLTEAERVMAAWARRVTRDPNGTSAEDVQELRDAGFSDADIFAMTVYVALRVALSTVNDALGARPDAEYRTLAPAPVRDAVTFGRPVDASPQPPR